MLSLFDQHIVRLQQPVHADAVDGLDGVLLPGFLIEEEVLGYEEGVARQREAEHGLEGLAVVQEIQVGL